MILSWKVIVIKKDVRGNETIKKKHLFLFFHLSNQTWINESLASQGHRTVIGTKSRLTIETEIQAFKRIPIRLLYLTWNNSSLGINIYVKVIYRNKNTSVAFQQDGWDLQQTQFTFLYWATELKRSTSSRDRVSKTGPRNVIKFN